MYNAEAVIRDGKREISVNTGRRIYVIHDEELEAIKKWLSELVVSSEAEKLWVKHAMEGLPVAVTEESLIFKNGNVVQRTEIGEIPHYAEFHLSNLYKFAKANMSLKYLLGR